MLIKFCSNFRELENFSDVGWMTNNRCLLFKFFVKKFFKTADGGLVLVFDDDTLVHASGYYRSTFDPDVFLTGVRTVTLPCYRHKLLMSSYNVPLQTEGVRKLGGKMMMYTFDKDKSLYNLFVNKKFNLFLRNRYDEFNVNEIYGDLTPYEHPVYVNYTTQNVLYKLLDPAFEFEWSKIRLKNV
jgi:hypothetical protein